MPKPVKNAVLMCLHDFRASCPGIPLGLLEERALSFDPDANVVVRGDPDSTALRSFNYYRKMLGWPGKMLPLPTGGSMLLAVADSENALRFLKGRRVNPYHSLDTSGASALAEKIGPERVVVAPIDQVRLLGNKASLRRFATEQGWSDDFPRYAGRNCRGMIMNAKGAFGATKLMLRKSCQSVRVVFDPDSASGEGSARWGKGGLELTPEAFESQRKKWRGTRLQDGQTPYLVEEWQENAIAISFTWLIDVPCWSFEGYVRQYEQETKSHTRKYAGSLAVERERDLVPQVWACRFDHSPADIRCFVLRARERFESRYIDYALKVGWRGAFNIDALILPDGRVMIVEINPRNGGSLIARKMLQRELERFNGQERKVGQACFLSFPDGLQPAPIFDRALALSGGRGVTGMALPFRDTTRPWALLAMPTASEEKGGIATCLSAPVDQMESAQREMLTRLQRHSLKIATVR